MQHHKGSKPFIPLFLQNFNAAAAAISSNEVSVKRYK
jgi:hypothetical protein